MEHFGWHFILDCSGCDEQAITDKETIYNFSKELVKRIEMTAYGEPIIEYMLPGDEKEGYTLVQLITTSTIMAHFLTKHKTAYIDVFSCKKFNTYIVENTVKEFFKCDNIRFTFLTRNADKS